MKKSNKGFTLVEIMIVILIIAVMAAVLVPALGGAIRRANESAALQAANRALVAAQVLATEKFIQTGEESISVDQSEIELFLGKEGIFGAKASVTAVSAPTGTQEGGAITSFTFTDKHGIVVNLNDEGELVIGDSTGS